MTRSPGSSHRVGAGLVLALAVGCGEPEAPPPPPPAPTPVAAPPVAPPPTPPAAPVGTIGLGALGAFDTPGVVRTAPPVLTGDGLTAEVVRRVVRRHINEIRACYEAQLTPAPDLGGRLTVRWQIEADGTVTGAAVAASTLATTTDDGGAAALAVGTCVVEAIGGLLYPAPEHGTVGVEYAFVLSPRSEANGAVDGVAPEPDDLAAEGDGDFGGLGLTGTGRGGS